MKALLVALLAGFTSEEGGFAVTFPFPEAPTRTSKVITGVFGTGTLTMWGQEKGMFNARVGYHILSERALLRSTSDLFDSEVAGAIAGVTATCKVRYPECTVSLVGVVDYLYGRRDLPGRSFILRVGESWGGFLRQDVILDRSRHRAYMLAYFAATEAGLESAEAIAFKDSFRLLP